MNFNIDRNFTQKLYIAAIGVLNEKSREFYNFYYQTDRFLPFYITGSGADNEWNNRIKLNYNNFPIESIPSARLRLPEINTNIDIDDLSGKYGKGTFTRDEGGLEIMFNADFTRIPIDTELNLVIECSNIAELDQVKNMIIHAFFQRRVSSFDYLGSEIDFEITIDSNIVANIPNGDFSEGERKTITLEFPINIQSNYISLHLETIKDLNQVMTEINNNL